MRVVSLSYLCDVPYLPIGLTKFCGPRASCSDVAMAPIYCLGQKPPPEAPMGARKASHTRYFTPPTPVVIACLIALLVCIPQECG
jgi:hypothetical protein